VQSHTHYGDAAISNATLNARHDTAIWRTWVMSAGSYFAFKIVAKPLQIDMVANGTIADPYDVYGLVTMHPL